MDGNLYLVATELDVNRNGTDGIDVGANSNLTFLGHESKKTALWQLVH